MKIMLIFGVGLFMGFFDTFWFFLMFLFVFLLIIVMAGNFNFNGFLFCDPLSFFLIFLSIWIFLFCFFSSFLDKWTKSYFSGFSYYMASIYFFLFFSFMCFNMIIFYICFEFIFLIMFLFVLSWGYSPERLQASFYMVFYTLTVSFPFLVWVVFLGLEMKSVNFFFLYNLNNLWVIFAFLVFLVKMPVYGVHLWLPKAHVEAPVAGSMVLAGVLLKLGFYGILRFMYFVKINCLAVSSFMVSWGLLGGLVSCMLCIRQVDLKLLVAYSSVVHMSFAFAGMFSNVFFGYCGTIYMLIAHGFCSSCLFYILYVFYERFHSRSSLILKGSLYLVPSISLIWFLFSIFNVGVPPSLSFFSEVMILISLGFWGWSIYLFLGFFLFFTGLYGIYMYVLSNHSISVLAGCLFSVSLREFLVMYGHLFPLLFIPFFSSFFF